MGFNSGFKGLIDSSKLPTNVRSTTLIENFPFFQMIKNYTLITEQKKVNYSATCLNLNLDREVFCL